MKEIESYLTTFAEELGKESYSIVNAGVNTLIKTKGEIASYTIDCYMNSRFNIRLEDFTYEQEQLSSGQKKIFYESVDRKQLNYLFELLDKTRVSTYDLHAKILAKLYTKLILNKKLSYFESNLLSHIDILNEDDITSFYSFLLPIEFIHKEERVPFKIDSFEKESTFRKCIQLGLLKAVEAGSLDFQNAPILSDKTVHLTDFSFDFFKILKEIKDSNGF